MEERVHFYKSCLLLMLQLMVAYLEACLSDFYLATTGVSIWVPFSETGSADNSGMSVSSLSRGFPKMIRLLLFQVAPFGLLLLRLVQSFFIFSLNHTIASCSFAELINLDNLPAEYFLLSSSSIRSCRSCRQGKCLVSLPLYIAYLTLRQKIFSRSAVHN